MAIDAAVINAADAAEMSSSTGGLGTLTLAEVNGSPKLRDKWASGVHVVPYTVRAENGMREWGLGNYNAGTDQLERPDTVLSWAPGVGYASTKVSLPTSGVRVGFSLTVAQFNQVQTNLQALQADVTAFVSQLAAKASASHGHAIADISGLQAALDYLAGGGSGIVDGDRGDIAVTDDGTAWTINDGVVDTSKLGGDVTAAGKAWLTAADQAAQRAALSLGSAALQAAGAFAPASHGHAATDLTSGVIPTARLPALTGDVTRDAGTTALAIPLASIGTSKLGGDITTPGKNLLTGADQAAQRTALGLGSAATASSAAFAASGHAHSAADISTGTLPVARGGTGATDAAGIRSSAGLVIGTDVQAFSAKLAVIVGATWAANMLLYLTGTATLAATSLTAFGRTLLALADVDALKTLLGYTTAAAGGTGDMLVYNGTITEFRTKAQVRANLAVSDQVRIPWSAVPANGTFKWVLSLPGTGTINALKHELPSGSVTVNVKLNSTSITGLSAVAPTSTKTTTNATAANTWADGDELVVTFSGASSPGELAMVLLGTRLT